MRFILFLSLGLISVTLRATTPTPPPAAAHRCALWTDAQGVTHARAADETSAYACLGFLHGRDRGSLIEAYRRFLEGTASEVLGSRTAPFDLLSKLLELRRRADALFAGLPPDTQAVLKAYAAGINRGFAAAKATGRDGDFRTLSYDPAPWRAEDSVGLVLLSSMMHGNYGFLRYFQEETLKGQLGVNADRILQGPPLPWETTILKPGEYPAGTSSTPAPSGGGTPAPVGRGSGSNAWVIAPAKSATGRAWLANDPHAFVSRPLPYYWVHLAGGDLDVTGGSTPGFPAVIAGFNRRVAWGVTTSFIDSGDVVSIPAAETREFERRRPTVWFKAGFLKFPYFPKDIKVSPEGWPVVPTWAPLGAPEKRGWLVRWNMAKVDASGIAALFALPRSKSAADADRALAQFTPPGLSFVFADVKGTIGYRATGATLRKAAGTSGIVETTLADARATPHLSSDEMPRTLSPKRGFLAAANNRPWGTDARYHVGSAMPPSFRAFRIEELLTRTAKHSLESQRAIQCDAQAVDARFLLPRLLATLEAKPKLAEAVRLLATWDYTATLECRPCAIYERWMELLREETKLDAASLFRALDIAHEEVIEAVRSTFASAVSQVGMPPAPWAELHRMFFHHVTEHRKLETSGWLGTPGTTFSVNAGGGAWREDHFDHAIAAPLRLIVEMTEPPTAHFALAGPNEPSSASDYRAPGSPWLRWRDCELGRAIASVDWSTVKAERIEF